MGMLPINPVSVGIDVGCSTLRGIALKTSGTSHEIIAAAETRRTPNHAYPIQLDVQRLVNGMQRQGHELSRVTLSASPERLACAIIELPPRSSGAPVESLAAAEIAKNVSGTFESCLWDLPDAPRQSASEYLTAAFSHADAGSLIEPFEAEGVFVDSIEPEATALGRVTGSNNRLVLDMGRRGIRMYAYEGKNVLFARNLARNSETERADRVYADVVRTIDYLATRFPCLEEASVVVLGKPAEYAAIRDQILCEFEAEITNAMPIELSPKPWLRDVGIDAQWATALGLALRPAQGEAA